MKTVIAEYIREMLFRVRWLTMSDRQRYAFLWERTKETLQAELSHIKKLQHVLQQYLYPDAYQNQAAYAALHYRESLTSQNCFDYYGTEMRIGLLADTHIPDVEERLPSEVAKAFYGVDLILHAGDIYDPSVLDDLEQVAPVLAARGDDDYLSALRDRRVQEKHVLEIDGHILWLVHERAYYLQSSWFQSRVPTGQERYDFPDIVVFGHEHRTFEQRIDNILFVSPGSPTFLGYRYGLGTVGILNINSGRVDVNILQLQDGCPCGT